MSERLIGKVKWFDGRRGFGFITADNKDYFVHYKSIMGTGFKNITDGQTVSFLLKNGNKGLMADAVIVLDSI